MAFLLSIILQRRVVRYRVGCPTVWDWLPNVVRVTYEPRACIVRQL